MFVVLWVWECRYTLYGQRLGDGGAFLRDKAVSAPGYVFWHLGNFPIIEWERWVTRQENRLKFTGWKLQPSLFSGLLEMVNSTADWGLKDGADLSRIIKSDVGIQKRAAVNPSVSDEGEHDHSFWSLFCNRFIFKLSIFTFIYECYIDVFSFIFYWLTRIIYRFAMWWGAWIRVWYLLQSTGRQENTLRRQQAMDHQTILRM